MTKNKQASTVTASHRSKWDLSWLGLELNNPRWWLEIGCIAIAYFAISRISATIIVPNPAAPIWPGAGSNVGLLLAWGRSRWLGVFLGTFWLNIHRNGLLVLFPSLGASTGSTIGTLITVSLILRFIGRNSPLQRVRNVVWFSLCSIFSGTIIQTITGTLAYSLFKMGTGKPFAFYFSQYIWNWWIGDSIGVLLFAPLILVWLRSPKDAEIKSWFNWEVFAALISLVIVSYLCLYNAEPLEYLLLPPLFWSAFRFGSKLTTLLVTTVAMTASVATANKLGIFYQAIAPSNSLILLQIFMGVLAITTMAVLAIVAENRKANFRLQRANAELEQRVLDRTRALQASEVEAIELAEKAEAANQAKSIFIANMSHELRSHLNAVIGFSQLMIRAKNLAPEHQENASIIYRSGDYLLTLINNILDLSKIESGTINLNSTNFDLHHLLNDIEDMLHLRAVNLGLHLIIEFDHDVPRYIYTDEVKLRQILINLIGNAIKFTKQGEIYVHISNIKIPEQNSTNCTLNFNVTDTGVGISAEELSDLFISFSQTQAGKEKQEGTGLGLVISRQFAQLMGGDMNVTSELGKGSTFQFTIQAQLGQSIIDESSSKKRALALAPDQPIYKILVVDDKPINCDLIAKMLIPTGFEVQSAQNGQEAIAIWEQWEPHLIWMDMRMPVMDGYEATKQIKATTKGNATAVIALTASVLEEEKAIVLSAGCDDFVRKPFSEQTIFDMLAKHLGVKYIYEEIASYEGITDLEIPLTSNDLKIMQDDWIMRLYKASLEAEKNTVLELIGEIPDQESSLVRSLTRLARNFQFEQLIDLTGG